MQVAFITGLLNIFKELSEWGSTKGKGKNNSYALSFNTHYTSIIHSLLHPTLPHTD